jgi:DNA-binding NarL/FixJ family response regulator
VGERGDAPRVLVLEDYALTARSLADELTGAGCRVLGTCPSLASLAEQVAGLEGTGDRPDLVVTDLCLTDSDPDGREVMRTLAQLRDDRWPDVRILVHTRTTRPAVLTAAFAAGAHGFLSKNDEPDLLAAVRRVLDGVTSVSPSVASYLRRGLADLTPKQQDVLERLAEGYSNEQILASCGIGQTTLDTYLEHLREIAGIHEGTKVSKRVALTQWARGGGPHLR